MRTANKTTKTFSLDQDILAEVSRTKGRVSSSQRVNGLLRFALDLEKKAALHEEAASFFSGSSNDRAERRAYQAASMASWRRS